MPSRTNLRRPRIFLGLTEIAGYYASLAEGFRRTGVEALHVALRDHPYGYAAPVEPPRVARWLRRVVRRGDRANGRLSRAAWRAARVPLQAALLFWALPRFDVFVFGFGGSFLAGWDLPLLRVLGKRVVLVFHGSDSRPAYLDGLLSRGLDGRALARATRRQARRVRRMARHADVVVDNPLSGHFQPRPFVPFQVLGRGVDVTDPAPAPQRNGHVRIVHAPSDPEAKGSDRIRDAVARLRATGLPLEFVELRGVPHAEVMRELAQADVVVDQLYSDTQMAGLAAEAASVGRPVVVGGYDLDLLDAALPTDLRAPVVRVHPDALAAELDALVRDGARRAREGARGRAFVVSAQRPEHVAERFLRVLRGEAPAEWSFDPRAIRAVHGFGLPEDRARRNVAAVLAAGGPRALCLPDNPDLTLALVAFARGESPC